jgi:hypothetical protein
VIRNRIIWRHGGGSLGAGREVIFALRIAGSAGYLGADVVARQVDEVHRVVAVLHKLTYPRR